MHFFYPLLCGVTYSVFLFSSRSSSTYTCFYLFCFFPYTYIITFLLFYQCQLSHEWQRCNYKVFNLFNFELFCEFVLLLVNDQQFPSYWNYACNTSVVLSIFCTILIHFIYYDKNSFFFLIISFFRIFFSFYNVLFH